jgi:predicted TIM-barrel fold metal-dependent hydrolase
VSEPPQLLDDHAHPFPLKSEPLDLASLSLAVGDELELRRREAGPHRLMLELLRVRLADLLGCAADDVGAAREEAAADWPSYVRHLMSDAGISGMLLDGAMSPLAPADLAPYESLANVPMWSLLRLEAVIDPLLEQGADGPDIESVLADFVASGAADGAAGLKTVLAYRTGLAVDPNVTAEKAYRSVPSAGPVRTRAKPLRDYLLRRTFAQCADLGLPIQIHTGFGDSEIRLARANPILLDDVLRTPEGAAAKVVLIHAGYPWHEQLAYFTLVRRNVWAEISLLNLFSPATTADRLLRLLDLAPADRLVFGTDGHGLPETHWFAARVLRDAWDEVRRRLGRAARDSWLDDAAQHMFAANARELYRLS